MPDKPPATTVAACTGGPLDGRLITIPDGWDTLLAADRVSNRGWLYQRQADGRFALCTDHDASLIYADGPTTGERRLDWQRLDGPDRPPVINIVAAEENHAGAPVDDGFELPLPPAL